MSAHPEKQNKNYGFDQTIHIVIQRSQQALFSSEPCDRVNVSFVIVLDIEKPSIVYN